MAKDKETCCNEQKHCMRFDVPDGYSRRVDAPKMWRNDWDKKECFFKRANCGSYSCPAGFVLKDNAESVLCQAEACEDQDAGMCCRTHQHRHRSQQFSIV